MSLELPHRYPHCHRAADADFCDALRLHDLARAQGSRAYSKPHRPQQGRHPVHANRPLRPWPTGRRRHQDDLQGKHCPARRRPPLSTCSPPSSRSSQRCWCLCFLPLDFPWLNENPCYPSKPSCSMARSFSFSPSPALTPLLSSWPAGPRATSTRCSAACAPSRRWSATKSRSCFPQSLW